jgi:hypothetical protein
MKKVPPGEAAHFFSFRRAHDPERQCSAGRNGRAKTKMVDGRRTP